MKTLKETTVKAAGIIADFMATGERDIFDAYHNPSTAKIRAFRAIRKRAENTPGYNNDLHITAAGSQFFSTVYSYTENGERHIIKDTAANTYHVIIPA